ncbi:putative E3 ubiquitin-protein ligase LUL4 [Histomonas meleagridis]|uniref:putative E3 ubiquitin-protein ligase LUL4 n=1 Tax=Histomonas meleagridis TaxID=135588 RepID=UPI003559386E|nr:putative E3 ubiquitin-protein ligase LUL4 [Histomonas meleagridis]KAH0800714.1 putative E3 ubiquitin-protein ligase LUL4 [Histomonas meleagridis]KAH0800717.1 putative E3 ubiquitin-protein ligase LUL4 [Histomonas meleagridis]
MWFSYYGPINHAEASEALDAAITSHLQEIGSSTAIPIKKEKVEDRVVPVALNEQAFTEDEEHRLQVHFDSTLSGNIIIYNENLREMSSFNSGLNLIYTIKNEYYDIFYIRFDFEVEEGIKSRIYKLMQSKEGQINILEDQIDLDNVLYKISRVYTEQSEENDNFSDGLCLICCNAPVSVIAFPCRHCCMCRSCSEHFASISNKCPVCRSIVRELIDCSS